MNVETDKQQECDNTSAETLYLIGASIMQTGEFIKVRCKSSIKKFSSLLLSFDTTSSYPIMSIDCLFEVLVIFETTLCEAAPI